MARRLASLAAVLLSLAQGLAGAEAPAYGRPLKLYAEAESPAYVADGDVSRFGGGLCTWPTVGGTRESATDCAADVS